MRSLHGPVLLLGLAAPGLVLACTPDRGMAGDASSSSTPPPVSSPPTPSSTASPPAASGSPAAATTSHGVPVAPSGPVVEGKPCSPGRDSIACTPDGHEVLTCAGGQWRSLQACRGPGRCKGFGSALTCDTGLPQPGDPCVAARAESQCRNAHEAIACRDGKWMVSPCAAGHMCAKDAAGGQAGCK